MSPLRPLWVRYYAAVTWPNVWTGGGGRRWRRRGGVCGPSESPSCRRARAVATLTLSGPVRATMRCLRCPLWSSTGISCDRRANAILGPGETSLHAPSSSSALLGAPRAREASVKQVAAGVNRALHSVRVTGRQEFPRHSPQPLTLRQARRLHLHHHSSTRRLPPLAGGTQSASSPAQMYHSPSGPLSTADQRAGQWPDQTIFSTRSHDCRSLQLSR
eukprot:COSAG06_NODE_10913_length_1596_cov_12.418170_3_plen_217_part_00